MLVLTRKMGEGITIDGGIRVVVVQIRGGQVRLGIEAPLDKKIARDELRETLTLENHDAANSKFIKKVAKPIADS